jgi:lactate dehydrogenase-like 2-hydroxyacid dehydrogenase
MEIVILDALTFGETSLEGFKQFGEVTSYQTTAPDETLKRIENADVIVTNKVVITEAMMLTCKRLKLICITATGMNNVDLNAAKTNNIEVKNVAGYSTDSVIQHTFSMLFYLMGHSRYYDEYVKDGSWQKSAVFTNVSQPFFEVKNKKWGIIGLGEIGHGVGNIAKAFGAEVSYYSTSGRNRTDAFQRRNLDDLLKESDIISIHAPLNDATLNLLDYEQLLTCKEGATILNLGRGGIINEEAVAKIIDEKELYFGLDVLEKEPMKADHPLLHVKSKERLYITPHIAWTSVEAREKLIAMTIENIKESV